MPPVSEQSCIIYTQLDALYAGLRFHVDSMSFDAIRLRLAAIRSRTTVERRPMETKSKTFRGKMRKDSYKILNGHITSAKGINVTKFMELKKTKSVNNSETRLSLYKRFK